MNTAEGGAVSPTWQNAIQTLRRRRVSPADMSTEIRLARREEHAIARCRLHLACYLALGIIILAWITGIRDWVLDQIVDHPAIALIVLASSVLIVLALKPLLTPQSLDEIEQAVYLRHRRADQARLNAVAPMISGSKEVEEIVSEWMRVLPALRNLDLDELDRLNVIWRQCQSRDTPEDVREKLKGYVANGT